jgi:protocatechuate 3,4-dioxygenase alpha subunit
MTPPLTPSQTVGPFFAIGLGATVDSRVAPEGSTGALRLSGQVFDGDGQAVPDAVVETWQPEGVGRSATLIGVSDGSGLRFDIHLQGGRETVFFDR